MEMAAAKLMNDEEPLGDDESAVLALSAAMVPDGFVPATKAQVAYWRQLCGAITTRGADGMQDTDWPPDLSPNSLTLRELQARCILVRRSRAWHLRRSTFA